MREVWVQKTRNGWVQVVAGGSVVASYRGAEAKAVAASHESELRIAAAVLDEHIPERGPCGICGHDIDQTHRVIDSIAGLARAELAGGEDDVEWVAEEFGYPDVDGLVDACLVWSP